ncbi:MAG: DUF3891 family protein [Chloroflexota bacterium]|nr:DUF3891 family protein [Chloroflexota bacterium]
MIVNAVSEGWEVITQRAHALLAAQLIAPWHIAERPPRWVEILAALVQHDDEENYWEQTDHLSELGSPLNFDRIGIERAMVKERRVITSAYEQDTWVGLLISRHNTYIYEDLYDTDKRLTAFLDEQADNQKRWLKQLGIKRDELEAAYTFMNWGDRLSLILCQRQLPDKERRLEITIGPGGQRYEVFQHKDGTVGLEPYPYAEDELTFSVNKRILTQPQFKDTVEFRKAVDAAPVELYTWTFKR